MQMLIKDSAICIRAIDYSETSQIVTFFTRENGKIGAIAKGSKRAKSSFDGPIEVFSYGKIVFSPNKEEKLATLTEFQQEVLTGNKVKNLFVLNCMLFGAELVNQLTDEYDPHPQLFDNMLEFIKHIQQYYQKTDSLKFLILFQLGILKEAGLQPILNKCVNCKNDFSAKWTEAYFSSQANGIICRDCEASFTDKIKLNKEAARCMADLKSIGQAGEKILLEIEKILIYHFTELAGRPPKMAKHILGK